MTKSVNEGEDAGGAAGQGGLFSVSLFVWILWPAVFVLIFRDATYDFLGAALKDYLFYPPSLINITTYWGGQESVLKSLYLSAWYANSLMLSCCYLLYLLGDLPNRSKRIQGVGQRLKAIGLALFGLVASFVIYSSTAFETKLSITHYERFLLDSGLGQFVLIPLVYVGAACAPFGAIDLFIAACRSFGFNEKGDRK
ncbi:MAG TPA: hypothetical protein VLG41_17470 [Hydrogenophaga sp.]|uniref:hypothetical protein n=1 Tax=Hydrogenophaga sp. TaxID=1904254 RepID=UPI002B81B84D|nr:hypothetical protein [Hydrogenophaga sp.]HSX94717.1 hypothetical protein [Hydrogenophaga sp.]